MTDRHVVVGAGAVGRSVAQELTARGSEVVLVSRSGAGPEVPGASRAAADVADAEQLGALAEGSTAIYNCINPPSYDVWSTYWPPIAAAFLQAAERSGAVLAVAASLYPYGPVDVPMVEGMPDAGTGIKARLRAGMWADAKELHEAGRIRVVEVRGSDYMGPGVGMGHIAHVMPRALAGKSVRVFGSANQPHSWTDVRDMGRAMVALAADESTWGRVWHAPTNEPRTQAEAVADSCRSVGREPVTVRAYPRAVLSVGGMVVPLLREMRETVYQFERPYVLDSSAIESELGLKPTPWDEVSRATAMSALEE
jgi:nucleoside-diphosphate-sugar epimerase